MLLLTPLSCTSLTPLFFPGSLYPTEELPRAQMDYFAEAESDVYAMANAPMDASYNEHLTAAEASAPPMFEDEVQDYMAPSAPSFEPMSANHQHQEYYQQDYEYTQEMIDKLD